MKKALPLALGVAMILSQSCGNNSESSTTTTDSTKSDTTQTANMAEEDGWVSLFDGSTTKGWHSYGKDSVNSSWKVVDGALYLDTTKTNGKRDGGDIITDQEYENYHLALDWKVAEGANSGIIFNVHEDAAKYPNTYNTGPEMQVLDNERHPDAKIPKHRAGDLYDLISSSQETVKPAGEWNHAEVKVQNGKLDLYLNGTNVVSTTMWDDNWKKMVAGSKFKSMPDFGTFKKGHIALQDHGNAVWYKDIKIKQL